MPRPQSQSDLSKLYTLTLLVTTVAALYLASDILIPLALATLLTFILAPAVMRLQRLKFGRLPSVLIVVGAAFILILGAGWIVTNQLASLAGDLPRYESNLVGRIETVKEGQSAAFSRVERVFKRLNREIHEADEKKNDPDTKASTSEIEETLETKPVPVEIVNTTPAGIGFLTNLIPEAFGLLGTLGIVLVFLIFMLLARDDLRNRLIRLVGPYQITVTTQALDDAAHRVSRYLRAQLIINASYGLVMAIGLFLVGVPNALLLGLLGGMLRYIPYVGPWLGAGLGILLAVAESPPGQWSQPLIVMGLYLAAELLVNNVMEPLMYQSSTGVSTIGIILAAMFWTWLWGAVGLVLSMPLTVCIVVLGRYVPQLEFLHVMLSDTEVLPPPAHLYQRLLVSDEDEARMVIEDYLEEHDLESMQEHVFLPAMEMVEADSHRGVLNEERRLYILEGIQELLEESPELAGVEVSCDTAPITHSASNGSAVSDHEVFIVPTRDLADEIAGGMLRSRLAARNIPASLLSTKLLFSEVVEHIRRSEQPLVIISAVPPFTLRHARNMTKRLRHHLEGMPLLVAVWTKHAPSERTESRLAAAGCDDVVHRLSQAVEAAARHSPKSKAAIPQTKNEAAQAGQS